LGVAELLWACPECGEIGGIGPEGACRCGAVFQRARGASIEARLPDGGRVTRSPAEWVDRLPDPAALVKRGGGGGERTPAGRAIHSAVASAREASRSAIVRSGGRYLNRIEAYGPAVEGTLALHSDRLVFRPEVAESREWPLEALTAVQTSSRTLQVNVRGQPLVSFRFADDSVFFWELLLHAALREFYHRSGRGEIAEFQPRIVTR
jgi:hypothetical protein